MEGAMAMDDMMATATATAEVVEEERRRILCVFQGVGGGG
jgi:hypothetical protein